jgi:hypothetical protein
MLIRAPPAIAVLCMVDTRQSAIGDMPLVTKLPVSSFRFRYLLEAGNWQLATICQTSLNVSTITSAGSIGVQAAEVLRGA